MTTKLAGYTIYTSHRPKWPSQYLVYDSSARLQIPFLYNVYAARIIYVCIVLSNGLITGNYLCIETSIIDVFVVPKISNWPCNRNQHNKNCTQNHDSNLLLPLDQARPLQHTQEATHFHSRFSLVSGSGLVVVP